MKEISNKIKNKILKVQKKVAAVITKIVLFLEYFIVIMPTALLMKITRRDRLLLRKTKSASYWKDYTNKNNDYERLF